MTGQAARIVSMNHSDIVKIRADFPILGERMHGKKLAYLDNAATTQKPLSVIEAIRDYYLHTNANIHRGVYQLSEAATESFEGARSDIAAFINAHSASEVVFVRGTTEGINLTANSFVRPLLDEGDEIIISAMEHHSNIVPWQIICREKGAILKVIPMNDSGELKLEEFESLINKKTRFVSLVHISNSLGTINPVRRLIELAHSQNIPVLLDGAQAVAHMKVDIQELDCDFFVFSGHKVFGPTGIGVLYGKEELLHRMQPYQGGGEMIKSVTFEETIYNDIPHRFEAGTPNISGAIGLRKALDYVSDVGFDHIGEYENGLLEYAHDSLSEIGPLRIIGTAKEKAAVISFVLEGIHPHDAGTILDHEGIAVRTGHHCTQPVMDRFKIPATTRASFAFYNTKEEIDRLCNGVKKAISILT